MTRKVKHGGYSAVLSVIVVAAVIIINMIAGQMPQHLKSIDVSGTDLYEISDTTKEVLAGLEQDITIYVVGNPDRVDDRVRTMVGKYQQLSGHIQVEEIDTVLHPSWVSSNDAEDNSLLITCEATGKHVTVPFTDIVQFDQMSYYYYGQYRETEFDGEGQITSAIASASSDVVKTVYEINGHGEGSLSDSVREMLDKSGLTLASINLLTDDGIPEDADLVICNGPVTDFADDEKSMILDYLNQGGHMVLLAGVSENERPNLEEVMETYGLVLEDGYVADMSQNYQRNPYAIFPTMDNSSEIMTGIDSKTAALVIEGTAMSQMEELPENVEIETFMSTSADGVLVTEDSQTEGTWMLGARAVKMLDSGSSVLTVITTPSLISEQITSQFTNLSNLNVFMNVVTADFEDVTNISIPAKSLEVTYNTFPNAGVYGMVFIFLIPIVVLVTGLLVWTKRRKL
ncbi:MAG: GldG family protein [Hungatella hathewayi]|nr:GldG family protein [Hungatella hathewayi]